MNVAGVLFSLSKLCSRGRRDVSKRQGLGWLPAKAGSEAVARGAPGARGGSRLAEGGRPLTSHRSNDHHAQMTVRRLWLDAWSDRVAALLVLAGLGVLGAAFWPRAAADGVDSADSAGAAPPAWRREAQPLDLAALAAAPGLAWPEEAPLAAAEDPRLLALFVLHGRACTPLAGEIADYAAELAALEAGGVRTAALALVLDPTPARARRFAAAATLPMPAAAGWNERWARELGRFGDLEMELEQLVLIDRRRGAIVGRILLSTALTPVPTKRRYLAAVLHPPPPPTAADRPEGRMTR
jgi:hypothetical protein